MYTFSTHVRCMCNVERGEEGCDHSSIHMLYHPVIPWLATLTPSNQVKAKQLIFGVGVAFGAAYNRVVTVQNESLRNPHRFQSPRRWQTQHMFHCLKCSEHIRTYDIADGCTTWNIHTHICYNYCIYSTVHTHIYIYICIIPCPYSLCTRRIDTSENIFIT